MTAQCAQSCRSRAAALAAVLLAWCIGSQSAAAACAHSGRNAAASADEPARPIRHISHLTANHANAERYVVNDVCGPEGLSQISQLLKNARFEEMWAFLPQAHSTGQCQWHEVGCGERNEKQGSYLRVDMAYLEALMAKNSEIHVVHFHPLKYFECAADAGCPRERAPGKTVPIDKRWVTDLVFSMPSPSDVHFMMDVTSRFMRHAHARGTIRHKVVTPYGVVDYALTDKGFAKFDAERHTRSEGLYITWVMAGGLADDRVERLIQDHPGSILTAVRGLARSLNTEHLRLVHSALDESP